MQNFYRIIVLMVCVNFSISVSAQYINLPANIVWNGPSIWLGTTTVDDVEAAYNNARTKENVALSTSLPAINFPSNTVWLTMSVDQKVLWILNKERVDRGFLPYEGLDSKVTEVAQNYCQFLIDNDTSGHYADKHDPDYRLRQNADINACMAGYNENISYSYSGGASAPSNAAERLVYFLIYEDAPSLWGHRKNIFASNFNDNSGVVGKEGLLGVGFVISQNYKTYNYAAIVVCDVIDPCANWVFPTVSIPSVESKPLKISVSNTVNEFEITTNEIIKSIRICDINGRVQLQKNENVQTLSLQDLARGIYIAIIKVGNEHTYVNKIVIR